MDDSLVDVLSLTDRAWSSDSIGYTSYDSRVEVSGEAHRIYNS